MSFRFMLVALSVASAVALVGGSALADARPGVPIDAPSHLSRLISGAQPSRPASGGHSRPLSVAACSSQGDGCSNDGQCCAGHCVDGGCE